MRLARLQVLAGADRRRTGINVFVSAGSQQLFLDLVIPTTTRDFDAVRFPSIDCRFRTYPIHHR